ncbi:hypothetical protein [Streptomyces sp. NPDC091215]|uniref:hypothetical protein n=1 Tax=Streptomyces sp. NPDC091215 TaxID=3155192 RepID=UPI003439304D
MGLSDTPSFVQLSDAYWLDSPHLAERAPDPAPPTPVPLSVPPPGFPWRTAMVGLSALTVALALVMALV